jgi:ABC-2 type transport system permease protein
MSSFLAPADAALAVVKRDILVFRSYRLRFLGQVVAGFSTVAVTYYISRLVNVPPFREHDQYFAFAVIGLVIMEILFSTVGALPTHVRQELVAGTFERFVVSPFGASAGVLSMAVFPFMLALASGTITIAFAAIVFGMPIQWSTAALAVPLVILGCLSFAPFALLGAAAVIFVKQVQAGVNFVVLGIAFIAGFLFPVALLPGWIRWASDVQPFTPTVQLLRHVLAGTPMDGSAEMALLKVALAAVLLLPLATWALSLGIRQSQRQGTIIEY